MRAKSEITLAQARKLSSEELKNKYLKKLEIRNAWLDSINEPSWYCIDCCDKTIEIIKKVFKERNIDYNQL